MQLVENSSPERNSPLSDSERLIVGTKAPDQVRPYLAAFPDYRETPLVALPNLSNKLKVGTIALKDEGPRYGLGSFKALGGAYAVARLVRGHVENVVGHRIESAELLGERSRSIARSLTVCCATDGNHGRSVAAGAQRFGCRCVIFLHSGVSAGRESAIAQFGAEIRRTSGNYDESLTEANDAAEREGWIVVSDFSWDGYSEIPALVMQGYTVMLDEIMTQTSTRHSHVFVQGGVGGLAAVVAGYFLDRLGAERPCLIVVEPSRANCLQVSATKNQRTAIAPSQPTVMAMLECYEPSLIAWRVLGKASDFYLDVPDEAAVAGLKQLARPVAGDPPLTIGESGAAGLGGLMVAADDPGMRAKLRLDDRSNVLLFGTEGATDPEIYQSLLNLDTAALALSHA